MEKDSKRTYSAIAIFYQESKQPPGSPNTCKAGETNYWGKIKRLQYYIRIIHLPSSVNGTGHQKNKIYCNREAQNTLFRAKT